MGQDPEQLRAEIAATRNELDQDLNQLAEKVSPSKVVERRVDATKGALLGVKEKVMGVADSATSSGSDAVGSVGSSVSSAGHSVGQTVGSVGHSVGDAASGAASAVAGAPTTAKQKAQGNPLAAGLVAFGVGWLASSLLPSSKAEQHAAGQLKSAVAEPVKQQLTTAAQEVKDEVLPAAQEAVESVKGTATEAVGTVKDQAQDAAGTVKEQAQDSASTVKDQAQDAKGSVQETATGGSPSGAPDAIGTAGAAETIAAETGPGGTTGSSYDDAVARLADPLRDPLPSTRP